MAENTVPANKEATPAPATREETRYLVPPVDIYETETGLEVVADMPGVEKRDLIVRVEDDILTIEGQSHDGLPGDLLRNEFQLATFHRQFRLGEEVDQDHIDAQLRHGVLTIKLPKAPSRQPRQIDVQVG